MSDERKLYKLHQTVLYCRAMVIGLFTSACRSQFSSFLVIIVPILNIITGTDEFSFFCSHIIMASDSYVHFIVTLTCRYLWQLYPGTICTCILVNVFPAQAPVFETKNTSKHLILDLPFYLQLYCIVVFHVKDYK